MRTVPRHLLLAAVVLTVCCAQRQASATLDLQRLAAEIAGQRLDESRTVQHTDRQRREHRRYIRPAGLALRERVERAFLARPAPAAPECPLVHAIYPPSRYRLPPPTIAS